MFGDDRRIHHRRPFGPHGLRRLVEPLLPAATRANGGPDRTIPDRACFAAVIGSSA
jgi:hypothetical protein